MAHRIHHLHIKAVDPQAATAWYVKAFNFKIVSDRVRPSGDRVFFCEAQGGFRVAISGPRTDETLSPGSSDPHLGLEHFGITTDDLAADIARLSALGAVLDDGPHQTPQGFSTAFMKAPGGVRIELVQEPRAAAE